MGSGLHARASRDCVDCFGNDLVRPLSAANTRQPPVRNHVVVSAATDLVRLTSGAENREQFVRHRLYRGLAALLIAKPDSSLDQVHVAPAQTACGVAPSACVRDDPEAKKFLPVARRSEHLLDLRSCHNQHVQVLRARPSRAGDTKHRIRLDLALQERPSKEAVQRAMNRADRRGRAVQPLVEEAPAVVRRHFQYLDLAAWPFNVINQLEEITLVAQPRALSATGTRELAEVKVDSPAKPHAVTRTDRGSLRRVISPSFESSCFTICRASSFGVPFGPSSGHSSRNSF